MCISQQSCYSVGCLCVPPLRVFEKRIAPLLPPRQHFADWQETFSSSLTLVFVVFQQRFRTYCGGQNFQEFRFILSNASTLVTNNKQSQLVAITSSIMKEVRLGLVVFLSLSWDHTIKCQDVPFLIRFGQSNVSKWGPKIVGILRVSFLPFYNSVW